MTLTFTIATLILAASAHAHHPALSRQLATTISTVWRCQDQIGVQRTLPTADPYKTRAGDAYKRWLLKRWNELQARCAASLREKKRQWNWQTWLPRNWYLVGSCETGYGRDPNWTHGNSSYVSAFGIQRGNRGGQYDDDARKVGMPPWSDDPRKRPTPWQQYQTALSHYRSFGDGWGCPGP